MLSDLVWPWPSPKRPFPSPSKSELWTWKPCHLQTGKMLLTPDHKKNWGEWKMEKKISDRAVQRSHQAIRTQRRLGVALVGRKRQGRGSVDVVKDMSWLFSKIMIIQLAICQMLFSRPAPLLIIVLKTDSGQRSLSIHLSIWSVCSSLSLLHLLVWVYQLLVSHVGPKHETVFNFCSRSSCRWSWPGHMTVAWIHYSPTQSRFSSIVEMMSCEVEIQRPDLPTVGYLENGHVLCVS